MSGESMFPTDCISLEVAEHTSKDEALNCHDVSFTTSNRESETLNHNADINANGCNHYPDLVTNDIVTDVLLTEPKSGEFLQDHPDDKCSRDVTSHSDSNKLFVHVANDALTRKGYHDIDEIAVNPLTENNYGSERTFSSVKNHNMGHSVENYSKFQELTSPLHFGCAKQSLAVDGGTYLTQPGGLHGVTSEIENHIVDMSVGRAVMDCSNKKLLVLDVNGLLAHINSYVPYDHDPDAILCKKAVFKRPYCDDFLKFCFDKFNVGLWSSRTRRNMEPITNFLLGNNKDKLLFHWDQSHCTYTRFTTVEKRHKPLILKKLKMLWDKYEPNLPWEKGVYNESNTLLIDDSPYKALCNPPYTAIFPCTYRFRDVRDNSLAPEGSLRVYLEQLAIAENIQDFVKQNPFGQRPITEKNLSWGYYRKVIVASSSPQWETNYGTGTDQEKGDKKLIVYTRRAKKE